MKKCHKKENLCMEKNRKAFVECAKQFLPALMMKYGGPGMTACNCVDAKIIPNWAKYKYIVMGWIDKFIKEC
jgi:hypothetical protein